MILFASISVNDVLLSLLIIAHCPLDTCAAMRLGIFRKLMDFLADILSLFLGDALGQPLEDHVSPYGRSWTQLTNERRDICVKRVTQGRRCRWGGYRAVPLDQLGRTAAASAQIDTMANRYLAARLLDGASSKKSHGRSPAFRPFIRAASRDGKVKFDNLCKHLPN